MLQLSSGDVKTEFTNVKFQLNTLAPGAEQENSCRCTVQAVIERLSTNRIHYGKRQLRMSRQNDLSTNILAEHGSWMTDAMPELSEVSCPQKHMCANQNYNH